MKKSIVTRNVDQISIGNLITQLFIWNFDKTSVFQTVTASYTKSDNSKKSLKAINNTPATEIWQLLTFQNCQMMCRPYYRDKQHANISLLILMTDWLMVMHCSQKTTFYFLSVFYSPISNLSTQNHLCSIFLSSHIYFQEILLRRISEFTYRNLFWDICETSWRRQMKNIFFEIYLGRLKDVTKKTSFLRCIWDVLKTSQKRHLL